MKSFHSAKTPHPSGTARTAEADAPRPQRPDAPANSTPANVIITIKKDSRGRLWLGSFQNGLLCYDHGKITQYTSQNSGLLGNDIYGIQEDKEGNILVGLLNGNIQKLDIRTQKVETLFSKQSKYGNRGIAVHRQTTPCLPPPRQDSCMSISPPGSTIS